MPDERKEFEELTIKFGKGLAEDFTGKDGKAYKRILIPNTDPADHSPWASFVLPAKAVHENQYGKGLWAKIPAEGHTTVTKPERTDGIDGEIISTPSHSADSVTVMLDDGTAITGDLEPQSYIDAYTDNEALKADWEKIMSYPPHRILHAHVNEVCI